MNKNKKKKISKMGGELAKKVAEFVDVVSSYKVIRTPFFIIWFKWRERE